MMSYLLPPRSQSAKRFLQFVLAVEVCAVLWFALGQGEAQGSLQNYFGISSDGMHILAFAVLTMTALLIWPSPVIVGPCLVAAAGGLELLQFLTPERQASWSDFGLGAASALAISTAWFVFRVITRN